jgi:hypothetical protein
MPRTQIRNPVDGESLVETLDPHNESEARWLQDHSLLPTDHPLYGQPVIFHLEDGTEVSNDPNFAARQQLAGSGFLQDVIQAKAQEIAAQMVQEQMALANHQAGVGGEYHGNATNSPPLPDQGKVVPRQPDAAPGDVEEEEAPPYHTWSNDELRAELEVRQLETHGAKKDMADRLEQHDAAKAQEEKESTKEG